MLEILLVDSLDEFEWVATFEVHLFDCLDTLGDIHCLRCFAKLVPTCFHVLILLFSDLLSILLVLIESHNHVENWIEWLFFIYHGNGKTALSNGFLRQVMSWNKHHQFVWLVAAPSHRFNTWS